MTGVLKTTNSASWARPSTHTPLRSMYVYIYISAGCIAGLQLVCRMVRNHASTMPPKHSRLQLIVAANIPVAAISSSDTATGRLGPSRNASPEYQFAGCIATIQLLQKALVWWWSINILIHTWIRPGSIAAAGHCQNLMLSAVVHVQCYV